jgi:hypothetical protein
MKIHVPVLIAGCAVVLLAVAMWRYREEFAEYTRAGQQEMFGDASKRVQRAATGTTMGAGAIGLGMFGIVFIAMAIFAGPSLD